MSTQLVPEGAQALNAYDDKSFIKKEHSHQMWPNDPTCIAVFPAAQDRGTQFEPFNVPRRESHIATLPPTPLELFQLFLPISLVEKWVHYTKIWISWLKANEIVDSWKKPMGRTSRLRNWEGTYASEIYLFIAILIYMGIHIEKKFETYWSSPQPGLQGAEHTFIKFMPYWKLQLIHRHLRPFDHAKIDETDVEHLPKVFQGVEEWSDNIQAVSAELFRPGSTLAVDECMVRYTGKCDAKTTVKGKPDPVGFKIWVIAQQGFFLRWLWHIRDATYGTVGIELPPKKSSTRSRAKAVGKELAKEEKPVALNPTQAVVIALANLLPKATYHVFIDNLFSSSGLFRSLRNHGHGVTGTARKNCGIHKELANDKGNDGKVKKSYEFNKLKAIPTPHNKVNHIAWKDNKLVLFMTTVFTGADGERVERQRRKPSSRKPEAKPMRQFFGDEVIKMVQMPTVAAAYNEEMNHVDRGDQLRSYYAYNHPLRRGAWQALCWTFLLDVALVNSYLFQRYG